MKHTLQDLVSFFKGHWPHAIAAIPAAIVFTALHELAHCAAVWIQGGVVTGFACLPSGGAWGQMQYTFPPGVSYCAPAISLSPYAFGIASCLLAGVLSLRRASWRFWCASTIYVWLFLAPLADIANAALPYVLWNVDNDFRHGLGATGPAFAIAGFVFGVITAAYGFVLNKRLYRDRAVGFSAYCILAAMATLLVLVISCPWGQI